MDNDRRIEITNKIITIEQIKEVSNYLQKTCNYYLDLIKNDRVKNNNVYFDNAEYKYYTSSLPEVKYEINYNDDRSVQTTDEMTFIDSLKEPQFIKKLTMQLYIYYRDNELNEITEHNMSIYLTFDKSSIYFSTNDLNMSDQSYNLNSYVRGILESGEDRYSGIVKHKFIVKNIIGLAAGSILTLLLFLILLIMRSNGSDTFETLFSNGLVLSLLGWILAFAFGSVIISPIINNLFREIDTAESVYSDAKLMDIYKKEYTRKNEVLIGESYNNLEKRNTIRKIYALSKKVILVRLLISAVIVIVLTII